VWGKALSSSQAGYTNPISVLTPEDFTAINVATTEDLVKYEPSLVIRRRFIGDSNGTMGMRGSNMFQTSRSMVFADGVPLHYFLQSRFNGAPRWTLVSASEIAQVEVIYGPFSAEYSGNAMGGVVNIETAIPQETKFHIDSTFFSQDFSAYGFDDRLNGYKTFLSYGDSIGDLSVYLSYNRLENQSQPQSYYSGTTTSATALTPVTGAIAESNELGQAFLFFGDTGVEDTTTNNYKLKLGYNFSAWQTLLNVAYEDRNNIADSANTYVRDGNGNDIYSGNVVQNNCGLASCTFSIPTNRLNVSEFNRDSLSLGLRLKGQLTDGLAVEANLSDFAILKDESRSSDRNPRDPSFNLDGQVQDFGDTAWQTADFKLIADLDAWGKPMTLVSGVRYETYQLNLSVFDSNNFHTGSKDVVTSRSGGETSIIALFSQLNWDLNSQWDVALGLRLESWESSDGYFSADDPATLVFETEAVPSRDDQQVSPKFSLGYRPTDNWMLRYSAARAYRFPIVEELFSQYNAYNSLNLANPELKPENGQHHNIMLERSLAQGYWRINLYWENIEDVIENQSRDLPGGLRVRTFVPVDEIETRGVEFVFNSVDALIDNLDVRFNLAYTDAEIIKNHADPSIEGKVYPRMPEWRGNLLATYHLNDHWDAGFSVQYASDSFGRTDNLDTEDNVFSAQDGYTRLGLTSHYRFNEALTLGFGIDNLTDEIAYVVHPWPGRTVYGSVSYGF
jgi:iron complex outermembrane receptor protein